MSLPLGIDGSAEDVGLWQVRQGALILNAVNCLLPVPCCSRETLERGVANVAVSAQQSKTRLHSRFGEGNLYSHSTDDEARCNLIFGLLCNA